MALTVIPLHLNETIRQYICPDRDVEDIPETPFIKVYILRTVTASKSFKVIMGLILYNMPNVIRIHNHM